MILIDNRLQIAKLRLAYIVLFLLGNIFLTFGFFSNNRFLDNSISLAIGIVLLLVFIYLLIIKPEYVYIQIKKNNVMLIRTYIAFPFFRQYKSFEIQLNSILEIETKRNPFYPKPFFRVLVKTKKSVGKYPWLSLSAVPKSDYNKLATYFNKTLKIERKVAAMK